MNPPDGGGLAANPFYATAQQRLALARQRYFEDGVRPSGLVAEAVIQSWSRCLQARHDPARLPEFDLVTTSRIHSTLARSRQLLEAATAELAQLQLALAGTGGTAMLTDAQGVIVHTTFGERRPHERIMPVAARVGVNLAEQAVGTTAPGITAHTGRASVVSGCEHFFGPVQTMYCAAAPIHDVRGRLAGVLDLSSETLPFGFDAASVVGLYATAIENRLLCAQSAEHLVLQLQLAPPLLDTPMAGLAGVDGRSRIAWLNGAAARLLGLPAERGGAGALEAEAVFGLDANALLALSQRVEPVPLRLPNGLTVWVRARLPGHERGTGPHAPAGDPAPAAPASTPAPPAASTLRDSDRQLVLDTLRACDGNVSQAARRLGVSRGLIYRHLKRGAAG